MIHFERRTATLGQDGLAVEFCANDNGFPVPCRITCEELASLAGLETCEDNVLNLFEAMEVEVFDLARDLYNCLEFDQDGSILIGRRHLM